MKPFCNFAPSSNSVTTYIGCKFICYGAIKTCVKQYIGINGTVIIEFTDGLQYELSQLELVASELDKKQS